MATKKVNFPRGKRSQRPVGSNQINVKEVAVEFSAYTNVENTFTEDQIFTGDVYTVLWTDYGATSTIVGWAATPTANIFYKKVGNLVCVNFYITGTSDATTASFTLPYASVNSTNGLARVAAMAQDNTSWLTTPALVALDNNSDTVNIYSDFSEAVWTASGTKIINGQFFFEAQ